MAMQAAVETLTGLKRRIKVSVPSEQVDKQFEDRVKQRAKSVNLKGFRPGKVPLGVVKQHYGDLIRQELIKDLIQETFYEAVQKNELKPAGLPQIEPKSISQGTALEYEATFEIFPEFKVSDLSGITIEKLVADVNDENIKDVLDKLRKQHTQWDEIERAAQLEDRLIVDFVGTMNGEAFEGGSANEISLVLGSNSMIPGFEDGLIGAKAGSQVGIDVTFPENYPHKNLAGKPAHFAVTVKKIFAPKLPELDDEFAKQLDIKEGIEALRNEVRKSMVRELEHGIHENLKQQVIKELIAKNPIDVPEALIDAEIEQMQQQVKQRLASQMGQKNIPNLPREHFADQAKQRVIVGLLLAEYIKEKNLKADDSKVKAKIEQIAAAYDHPEQVVGYYYQHKELLSHIRSLVLEEEAIQSLLETASTKEKHVRYDEIVNPGKNQ